MDIVASPPERPWMEFLARVPEASIFHSPELARIYRRTKGCDAWVLAAEENGEVRALMMSLLISYGPSAPFPPAARLVTIGGPLGDASLFPMLLGACDRMAKRRVLHSQIRNLRPPTSLEPFLRVGYRWEDHLNYVLELRRGEEALLLGMSKSRRKSIGHAERSGLALVDLGGADLDPAYALLRETYDRAAVPLAHANLFRAAHEVLLPASRLWALGATLDGALVAVRFVLRWGPALYDWYAGSSDLGRRHHADEFLVWEAMRRGVREGCESFDFGGAGRPGDVYGPGEFKRRFGGTPMNPGRLEKTYHPVFWKTAQASYAVWRRLTRPAARLDPRTFARGVMPWAR